MTGPTHPPEPDDETVAEPGADPDDRTREGEDASGHRSSAEQQQAQDEAEARGGERSTGGSMPPL